MNVKVKNKLKKSSHRVVINNLMEKEVIDGLMKKERAVMDCLMEKYKLIK